MTKRLMCPRCRIRGHSESKCPKPTWWKPNERPKPATPSKDTNREA